MDIIRNGVTYTLTADELEQAFRERDKYYRIEDARIQLERFIEGRYASWGYSYDWETAFRRESGVTVEDLTNPESQHYVLDWMADQYDDRQDCNRNENSVWEEIVQETLSEYLAKCIYMAATFRILRRQEDGDYRPLKPEDIWSKTKGSNTFVVNGVRVPFDWNASAFPAPDGETFFYQSGYGPFHADHSLANAYDEDLEAVGLCRKDITGKYLAQASDIDEFFVTIDIPERSGIDIGNVEANAADGEYRMELLSITFMDEGDEQEYSVGKEVLERFNRGQKFGEVAEVQV